MTHLTAIKGQKLGVLKQPVGSAALDVNLPRIVESGQFASEGVATKVRHQPTQSALLEQSKTVY